MIVGILTMVSAVVAADPSFPPLRGSQHDCKIEVRYDRIKGEATETVDLGKLAGGLKLQIFNFYNGEKRPALTPADTVDLHFGNRAETWEFLKYRELTLLVEGKRFEYQEPKHDGSVGRGYVLEHMWCEIKVSDLIRFANATTIEGKLGIREFRLTANQIAGLKDFTARLGVTSEEAAKLAAQQKEEAAKIATQQKKERDDKRQKVTDAFAEAQNKATKAAQKLPRSKAAQRQRTYERVLAEEIRAICEKFHLTMAELKKIVKYEEGDDQ